MRLVAKKDSGEFILRKDTFLHLNIDTLHTIAAMSNVTLGDHFMVTTIKHSGLVKIKPLTEEL